MTIHFGIDEFLAISSIRATKSGIPTGAQRSWRDCGYCGCSDYVRLSQEPAGESLYQRKTLRARSVFQRLALPTSVSIANGIYSG